jgi:hypothetical protein
MLFTLKKFGGEKEYAELALQVNLWNVLPDNDLVQQPEKKFCLANKAIARLWEPSLGEKPEVRSRCERKLSSIIDLRLTASR